MWSYILRRLLLMVPTLLGILVITFVIVQFVPGGPVEQMVAPKPTTTALTWRKTERL